MLFITWKCHKMDINNRPWPTIPVTASVYFEFCLICDSVLLYKYIFGLILNFAFHSIRVLIDVTIRNRRSKIQVVLIIFKMKIKIGLILILHFKSLNKIKKFYITCLNGKTNKQNCNCSLHEFLCTHLLLIVTV